MKKRLICLLAANAGHLQFVYVTLNESLDVEANAFAVLGRHCLLDNGDGLVDNWTAVAALVDIGIGLHGIGSGIGKGGDICRLREGQLESVWLNPHFMNLERHLARPVYALKGEGLFTMRTPTAIGTPGKHAAVGSETSHDIAGAKSFKERKGCALIKAVDLLKEDAVDFGVGLLGNEKLVRKGTKLTARFITLDPGG